MCKLLCVIAAILCLGSSWGLDLAGAQHVPGRPYLDSSLKIGMLQARQTVRYNESNISLGPGMAFDHFRMDFGPRLALVSGMAELSPIGFASARAAASTSVLESGMLFFHTMTDPAPALWDFAPNFKTWEVAGLLHLWVGDGYRFSAVGGFRKDYWTYQGALVAAMSGESHAQDKLTADIPFIALQTSMSFPWWKARCEILGSPFMSKRLSAQFQTGPTLVEYEGVVNKGGLMEVTVEGAAGLTERLRIGAYGRYSYQELYGQSKRKSGLAVTDHETFLYEAVSTGGLNIEALF